MLLVCSVVILFVALYVHDEQVFSFIVCLSGTIFALKVLKKRKHSKATG